MSALVHWLKNNPILVVSACLAVVALIMVALVSVLGGGFRAEAERSAQQKVQDIDNLRRTSVSVPGESINDPMRTVNVVVNQAAIDSLSSLYTSLEQQRDEMFERVTTRNQQGKQPMLPGLFPRPTSSTIPLQAREEYVRSLTRLLGPWNSNTRQGLNAGPPPTDTMRADLLAQVQENYLTKELFPPRQMQELTPDQREQLRERKRAAVLTQIERRARAIHVYAQTNPRDPAFPFRIPGWTDVTRDQAPTMLELWEGQVDLWMYQDIAAAIAALNETRDTDRSVVHAPVKRLLRVSAVPGYVGVNSRGGLIGGTTTGPGSDMYEPEVRPRPGTTAATPPPSTDPNAPLPLNYRYSPTGRQSNALYDVRHVRVHLVVEFSRASEVLAAFRTNFMTVVSVDMKQVDEYEHLRLGYYYGPGDMVELDMIIECVWLRSWTAGHASEEVATQQQERFNPGLMPDDVRERLGLARRSPRPAGTEQPR